MLYQLRNKTTKELSKLGFNSRTETELFNYFLNSLPFNSFKYKEINQLRKKEIEKLIELKGFEVISINNKK